VIAAASNEDKLDFALSLGADVGVNYTRPDWVDELRRATDGAGPDLIYESAGGSVTVDSLQALAPLGQIVIYGALNIQSFHLGVPELLELIFKNQSVTGFAFMPLLTPERMKSALAELFNLVAKGELSVIIGGSYPLQNLSDAHRDLETRKSTGKLIVTP
jgi:NADPH2:quinone reductase